MRVYLGSDHAGLELKAHLIEHLTAAGHEPVDCGPHSYDPEDDYPPFCFATGERVLADPGSLGVVIGGSGNGEQIAANKVSGIRAALAWSEQTARLAREHNDAQVVSIGARMHTAAGGGPLRRRLPRHAVQRGRAAPAAHRACSPTTRAPAPPSSEPADPRAGGRRVLSRSRAARRVWDRDPAGRSDAGR